MGIRSFLGRLAFWRKPSLPNLRPNATAAEERDFYRSLLEELELEPEQAPNRKIRRYHGLYGPNRGVRGEMAVIRSRNAR